MKKNGQHVRGELVQRFYSGSGVHVKRNPAAGARAITLATLTAVMTAACIF